MPLMFQASPLLMQWCLECHRNPERVLRPRDQVFNMDWKAPSNQAEIGKRLAAEYKIASVDQLQSCSTCHR
jgi:cytochrome c peroxidase